MVNPWPDFLDQASLFGLPSTIAYNPVSRIEYPLSSIEYQVSRIEYPESRIDYPPQAE